MAGAVIAPACRTGDQVNAVSSKGAVQATRIVDLIASGMDGLLEKEARKGAARRSGPRTHQLWACPEVSSAPCILGAIASGGLTCFIRSSLHLPSTLKWAVAPSSTASIRLWVT